EIVTHWFTLIVMSALRRSDNENMLSLVILILRSILTDLQEDLEQIYEDDLEEMDLKWQLDFLSMRARRYFQRSGKKITNNGSDTAGYDKKKLDQRKEDAAKGDQAKKINWNDPTVLRYHALQNRPFSKAEVRKNMIMYLKNQVGYKQSHFKGMKYEDIKPIFKRVWDQVHIFVPKDTEFKKEVMKRPGFDLQQRSSKKQRITPDEDIAIDAIPLATNPLVIVEYKIVKEGKISTYIIVRADGSTKRDTRPEEGYERVLWGDLKVMFEPDVESEVWRQLQGHDVIVWKLFSSSVVHFVRFKNMNIFLLVDKVYPLTPATITKMLERKLQANQ
nr:hypothetical protein [Tanacetum cinerariifolium]